jgi:uncharacterized membrane protein
MVYAACPGLAWLSTGWFDSLAVLTLLAGLLLILHRRAASAGVLVAVGILAKLFPGVLLLAAPAALGRKGTPRLLAALGLASAAILAPLLAMRPDLLLASFLSMVSRPAWETLPALLSGNYRWGELPSFEQRFRLDTAASGAAGAPLAALALEAVLVLAVWGAWRLARAGHARPKAICLLVALGVTTFALGNKGFSPQFMTWIVPVVLLAWPSRRGVLYVGLLAADILAYGQLVSPVLTGHYTLGSVPIEEVARVAWVSVTLRTALLAVIAGDLFRQLLAATATRADSSSFSSLELAKCPARAHEYRRAIPDELPQVAQEAEPLSKIGFA